MPLKLTITVVLIFFLSGCVFGPKRLSEAECTSMNPYQQGLTDGANGQPNHYDTIAEQCDRYEITIDGPQYTAGWDEGIHTFCTPTNAFNAGKSGVNYPTHCPLETQTETFQSEYHRGNIVFQQIRSVQHQIDQISDELEAEGIARRKVASAERDLVAARENVRSECPDGGFCGLRRDDLANARNQLRNARNHLNNVTLSRRERANLERRRNDLSYQLNELVNTQ